MGSFRCCIFFLFLPIADDDFSSHFYRKKINISLGKKLLKVAFVALGLTVVSMIVFSEIYTASLMHKGYSECKGIPAGWMPGMATRYVKDPSNCTQY